MAYTLKAGKSIANPYDGSANTAAYGIIDDVGLNKQRKQIRFDLAIYANRNARASSLQALAIYTVVVNDPDFTTYFASTLNTTLWAQIQTYLVAKGLPSPLNIADWQVDGQAEP